MSNDLPDRRTPPGSDEQESYSREEVEAALRDREDRISNHSDALQRELGNTGKSLMDFVEVRPWVSLGSAAALGLGLSWLWGRRKRKRRQLERTHRLLTELYMDALADDVEYQMRKGKEADEAVYDALQDRVPLIFQQEHPATPEKKGNLRKMLGIIFKAAMGFAIKRGLDLATDPVGMEDFASGDDAADTATVAAAAS